MVRFGKRRSADTARLRSNRPASWRARPGAAATGGDPVGERKAARRPGITVSQVCDWYLEQAEAGRIWAGGADPSRRLRSLWIGAELRPYVKPLIGKKPVGRLSPRDIEEMQAEIAAGKTAKPRTAAAPKSGGKRKRPRGGTATGGDGVAARSLGMILNDFRTCSPQGADSRESGEGCPPTCRSEAPAQAHVGRSSTTGWGDARGGGRGRESTGLAAIRFIALSGFRRQETLAIKRAWLLDAGGVDFPDTKSGAQVRPLAALREKCSSLNARAETLVGSFQPIAATVTSSEYARCSRASANGLNWRASRRTS